MYFLIPGIVSQVDTFIVDGNIGRAIELVISEASNLEVYSAILARYVGEIEQCEAKTNSIFAAKELILIENIELAELTPTVTGFIDFDYFGATQSYLRNSLQASELITLESDWLEVSEIVTSAIEISNVEPAQKELQFLLPTSYFLLPTSEIAAQFLPGSPGYVAGIPGVAVELIGVETGTVPLPLPAGKPKLAFELLGVETGIKVSGTWKCSELLTIEVATNGDLLNARISPAREILIIEGTSSRACTTLTAREVLFIEIASARFVGILQSSEVIRIEPVLVQKFKSVTSAIEVIKIESSQKEASSRLSTNELFLSKYAANKKLLVTSN